MSINLRIKEEREKLGYSQEKLGAIGGVQKRAQINYESGERQPDAAYLRGIAQVGVDVQYVLLGIRSVNLHDVMLSDEFVVETAAERAIGRANRSTVVLSRRAAALLDNYENTDEAGKKIIEGTATMAAQSKAKRA